MIKSLLAWCRLWQGAALCTCTPSSGHRGEQSFLLLIPSVPGAVGVSFKCRTSAKPSPCSCYCCHEQLSCLWPCSAGWRCRTPGAGLCSSQGGCTAPQGHPALLPAGSSPCAPGRLVWTQRLGQSFALCRATPALGGEGCRRASRALQPPGHVRAAESISSPLRGARGGRWVLHPEPGPATAPAALACLGSAICSPEAMATCGKLAEGRAGLGNLKQH